VKSAVVLISTLVVCLSARAAQELRNDRYHLQVDDDGAVSMAVTGMPAQKLVPEFAVLWSETDPHCTRDASHPNYAVAPRTAVRWRNPSEPLDALNAWIASAEFKSATGLSGAVVPAGRGRAWEFHDGSGAVKLRVTGDRALDTTHPFSVGHRQTLRPLRAVVAGNELRWEFAPADEFAFAAALTLPAGDVDPLMTYTLTPQQPAWFSVAFTGAPAVPLSHSLPVPQECDARGHKQFDFVVSEADLHLPRAHVANASGNIALVADATECRFRLPTIADSRFGFMLAADDHQLRPVILAPLLGGPESQMAPGQAWTFRFHCVLRAGNWKETYTHIARDLQGVRDMRDNSGPSSLNDTLARIMDFLADRHGGNHALWDPQQKYYDYFTDKTGVFKPFSPLYGLSAAIVTDDEDFYRTRARPAIEYALSRKTSVFAPYDNADNKQANSAGRAVGAPYIGYAQLVTLDELFQRRTPVFRALAEACGPAAGRLAVLLAQWRLKQDPASLEEARATAVKLVARKTAFSEEEFFDLLDLAAATHDPHDIQAAREAAYHNAAKINLYPAPPDSMVTVDRGGLAPVHLHSYGRHHNIWGFPPPEPVRLPEQTVPAWRIARIGLPGIAYPIEYWMNTHGAMMRTAGLAHDSFLRDIARSGMVGRFGNYPGDNRSQDSLIPESPDAVNRPPWDWNFATVNPGHAWDFAGAVVDFIVSDAFERSGGAIDFPALSAAGTNFRVGIYGGTPGRFYDDRDVRLWLPRGLVTIDNRQFDWLAGYGNGQLYLAFWNQSFREETATIVIDSSLADCDAAHDARVWHDNQPAAGMRIRNSRFSVTVGPKGIIALAIAANVKPRLQAKLYERTVDALPSPGFADVNTPFGKVHAMLLGAGHGLTSAFVYAEAQPEEVITARLHWRQGNAAWQEMQDDIYPYEFSPELKGAGTPFSCLFEIQDQNQKWHRSPVITLGGESGHAPALPAVREQPDKQPVAPAPQVTVAWSDDFIAYLQHAANGHNFGLHKDGRYYPYSTPLGRRIGWRQPVWDNALYAKGCTPEEAVRQMRAPLGATLAALKTRLSARRPAVDFDHLDKRQQETLLDFAYTEGVDGLHEDFLDAVLKRNWERLVRDLLYVRYDGHAPDHPRNKDFAQRWGIP
jgi:hypothetical protein